MDQRWLDNYELAKEYYKTYGNLLIPRNYEVNHVKLGIWINSQRRSYKRNEMSKEKMDLLNSIEMVWQVKGVRKFDNNIVINDKNINLVKKEILKEFKKHLDTYKEKKITSKEDVDKINEDMFPKLK